MKKLFLFLFLLLSINAFTEKTSSNIPCGYSEYCDGWEAGWKDGYCYDSNIGCIPLIAPICPLPYVNKTSYKDGYNRGFLAGQSAH